MSTAKDLRVKNRDITKTVEVDTVELQRKQRARHEKNDKKGKPWGVVIVVAVVLVAGYLLLT